MLSTEIKIPMFRLELSDYKSVDYGCVTNCGIVNCGGKNIDNIDVFCSALGYTEEARKNGIFFDEFIWEEYTKAKAHQSPAVLQAKIVAYLNEHCVPFREKYTAG